MRRLLAWISIITALCAFAMFSLIFILHVKIIIPIALFGVALILLYIVKRMPNDQSGISKSKPNDSAFFDSASNGKDNEKK